MTCTKTCFPSYNNFEIGGIFRNASFPLSISSSKRSLGNLRSEACKKAAFGIPISIKAASIPGKTRQTLPL